MKQFLFLSIFLISQGAFAQRPSDQEATELGSMELRLGMNLKYIRSTFPNAKFKKEVFETTDDPGEARITATIFTKTGSVMANAYFDERQTINYIDFFSDFEYQFNHIKPGSLFKDLKINNLIRNVMYQPDGDGNQIGLWVKLKKYKNVEAEIVLTNEIKKKLIRFEYKPVPIDSMPLNAKIRCLRVSKNW